MTASKLRLYRRNPTLAGVCLFEVAEARIRGTKLLQQDPLAAVLDGSSTNTQKLAALAEAVSAGDYVVSGDGDEWALREDDLVPVDQIVRLASRGR